MTKSPNSPFVIEKEIAVWIDQGAIHMKFLGSHKDPVELSGSNAKRLAEKLLELARQCETE